MAYHVQIRVDGPIRPEASGSCYVVIIRDSVNPNITRTTIPASLAVCISVCRETNKRAKQTLAHIKYVGDGTETTETKGE